MNSQAACRIPCHAFKSQLAGPLRLGALFCLFAISAALLSGCARLKQYSVDSWQGPLPVRDMEYVDVGAPGLPPE